MRNILEKTTNDALFISHENYVDGPHWAIVDEHYLRLPGKAYARLDARPKAYGKGKRAWLIAGAEAINWPGTRPADPTNPNQVQTNGIAVDWPDELYGEDRAEQDGRKPKLTPDYLDRSTNASAFVGLLGKLGKLNRRELIMAVGTGVGIGMIVMLILLKWILPTFTGSSPAPEFPSDTGP